MKHSGQEKVVPATQLLLGPTVPLEPLLPETEDELPNEPNLDQ